MVQYIYFVKCPDCEDEHFDFFDEAKEFAMSCLTKKPIITQIEVDRNDFGECVDSCDLGTVWSWEEVMKDVPAEPEATVFSKTDTFGCVDCDTYSNDNCVAEDDPEFAALDNSLDFVSDDFRKPVPADKTIESLVEEMEENEDEVECKWCDELYGKDECRYEVDLGWLCPRCISAIKSRGETLTFTEGLGCSQEVLSETYIVKRRRGDTGTTFDSLDDAINYINDGMKKRNSESYILYNDSKEMIWLDVYRDRQFHAVDGLGYAVSRQEDTTAIQFDNKTGLSKKAVQIEDREDYRRIIIKEFASQGTLNLVPKIKQFRFISDDTKASYLDFEAKVAHFNENDQLSKTVQSYTDQLKNAPVTESIHDLGNEYDGGYPIDKPELPEIDEVSEFHLALCPECGDETFDHETGVCINCGFH